MAGLRIIGGSAKGRRLEAPEGLQTRPLPDRIRQSIFDYLGQDLDRLRVADIFSGSGSFGLESYSRGAESVVMVEMGDKAASCLARNIQNLGANKICSVLKRDALTCWNTVGERDLIFMDPPFPWFQERLQDITLLLDGAATSITHEGLILLRGEQGQPEPADTASLVVEDHRRYGRSWVRVFRKKTSLSTND